MKRKLHAIAGIVALLTISSFWISTILSELFGTVPQIIYVKQTILWAMILLIPALAATGASGFALGGKWKSRLVTKKKARMKIVALNGMLVLLPSAVFLATKAGAQEFDTFFWIVQAAEIVAGATNITLISLNAKDGFALSKGRKNKRKHT